MRTTSSPLRRATLTLLAGALGLGVLGLAPPAAADGPRHRVEAGDTLSELAEQLGTNLVALVEANDIDDPNVVVVGRRLVVPEATERSGSGGAGGSPVKASRRHLDAAFETWATANGFRPSLLKAICYHESGWQSDVISSTGAEGVCQIMPDTEDHMEALIGRELDSLDPEDNIRLGARYIRWLLQRTDGDVEQALAGYYQGLASVRRNGPYDETEQYVATVVALEQRF